MAAVYLSVPSAQQVVLEISTIVKQNINIMDEHGYIIASTDPGRVGNFHKGARKVIAERLPEYYVTPEAETPETRAGLNLPIDVNGEIIGVVGITGPYDQVFNYGQIVKKMTEILVRESFVKEQERLDKKIESRFLEDWILGAGMEQGQAFVERGIGLHIDITLPRRAMVLRIENFQRLAGTSEGQKTIEKTEQAVRRRIGRERDSVCLRLTAKQVCLVPPRSDEGMVELAEELIADIRKEAGVGLLIGIDGGEAGTADAKAAYLRANRASHACLPASRRIVRYSRINVEIFLGDIPNRLKREYLQKIFKGCGPEEMCRWVGILEAYFAAEGSIRLAAEKLYIHKNTLQYQLKKLREVTGYDVRLPSNSALFYVAVQFFRTLEEELPPTEG